MFKESKLYGHHHTIFLIGKKIFTFWMQLALHICCNVLCSCCCCLLFEDYWYIFPSNLHLCRWMTFFFNFMCRYAQFGDVSPKIDVYAFGVVLYELISAKEAIVKTGVGAESTGLVALVSFSRHIFLLIKLPTKILLDSGMIHIINMDSFKSPSEGNKYICYIESKLLGGGGNWLFD